MIKSKKEQKQQSFLYATLILGISTLLVKIMGACFKIPLARLIGESGMGYFSTAYDVYLPVYSLAMAGLPIAVSRIVASFVAEYKYKDARKTLKISRIAFLITGAVGFIVMFILAFVVTGVAKNPKALPAMFVIAPSILFCCVMSSYRGYYEGMRNMFPTAFSTLIEASSKLFLGFAFAFIVMSSDFTVDEQTKLSYAAAAAMLGITVGTVLGSLFLIIRHKYKGDFITEEQLDLAPNAATNKALLKTLVAFAIPVAIGSLVNNVASLIDVAMVQRQLHNTVSDNPKVFYDMYSENFAAGNIVENSQIPNYLYGCYKGYAYTIFNLIPTITSVVGISALPVLTMVWTEGNKTAIKANLVSIIKIITLIAFPAGIGLAVLAPQIVSLLFGTNNNIIATLLSILGIAACLAGITTPLTNILQAIGKPSAPVKNIAVGAVIKIVVNFILVGMPSVNILGAPIGTLCCYLYIAVADIICVIKYSHIVPNMFVSIVKPLFAAGICGAVAYFSNKLLTFVISSDKLVTVIAIGLAGLAYLVSLSVLRCISKEDIVTLSKSEKLARICAKLRIIR